MSKYTTRIILKSNLDLNQRVKPVLSENTLFNN